MTPPDPNPQFSLVGQMLRTPEEIARVLNSLVMRGEPIASDLGGGKRLFHSRLRFIDPAKAYIIVELSSDELANKELLARPRVMFHAEPGGWRVEFAAADPHPTSPHEGAPGIKLRFPEIVAGHRRRAEERSEVPAKKALQCIIDEAGIMPFDGSMANVSKGGIGFLQYDPKISLEPGTVLKGCRIKSADGDSIVVDMEVRYSQLIDLADGTQVQSSGCCFLNLSAEDTEKIEKMFDLKL
jgi:c-di-GMP-binding flagellar brake protein YcgR